MQKVSKWILGAGLSAIAMTGLAGCGGSDNAVPDSIESPVMNNANDSAIAGSGTSNAAGASTGNSTGNSAGAMSNSTMGNSASSSSNTVPAPNTGG